MSNGWFVPADAASIMVVVMLPLPQREAGPEDGAGTQAEASSTFYRL